MKYYEVKLQTNGVSSFLADLLNNAKRVGDIVGDWAAGYEYVYFAAKDSNNIYGKLVRNCYEVKEIG